MDADDFRGMVLNSTIASVAGAKGFDPSVFTLRRFLSLTEVPEISDEVKLDSLLGVVRN
jgi:hypothetical protein